MMQPQEMPAINGERYDIALDVMLIQEGKPGSRPADCACDDCTTHGRLAFILFNSFMDHVATCFPSRHCGRVVPIAGPNTRPERQGADEMSDL